jgi:hypothetical protein
VILRRRPALLVGTLLLALVIPARAAAPDGDIPELAEGAGLSAMLDLETKMTDSLQFGHAVPVIYDSPEKLPGHVIAAPYWGDTALWSGVYLGGEAMRYAVAKSHPGDSFWDAQRDQALDRVRTLLAGEHRDISIAEDWSGTLRIPPAVNTVDPTGPHTLDFGGGIIHGERGMVTRGCTPVDRGALGVHPPNHDAANPINDHSNHVFQITWHEDGVTYNCETSPSRDTYAGMTFGLLTAYDLVGPDEPALQEQIRGDVLAMASFLLKYGWSYPRPHGYVGTGSDEDGFISPLMAHVPTARLNIAHAAKHVAATAADRQKWAAVWIEEFATQAPIVGASLETNNAQPNDGYFKFNLEHLIGFNLLRTLTGTQRDVVADGFAVMDKTTRDDVNAHFEAITYALTGESSRRDAAVTHLMQWLDYSRDSAHVRDSPRCGAAFTCVPKDQYGVSVEPVGSVAWFPGMPDAPPLTSASGLRAAGPLPVAVRPPADFLWQRSPTDLDGDQDPSWREPGIDFLTPYWMLRFLTEVDRPSLRPFTEWVGPAHE